MEHNRTVFLFQSLKQLSSFRVEFIKYKNGYFANVYRNMEYLGRKKVTESSEEIAHELILKLYKRSDRLMFFTIGNTPSSPLLSWVKINYPIMKESEIKCRPMRYYTNALKY